jgi:hypothetical protein
MKFGMPQYLGPTEHDTWFSDATGPITGVPDQFTSGILALKSHHPGGLGKRTSWSNREPAASAGTRHTSMEVHDDKEELIYIQMKVRG